MTDPQSWIVVVLLAVAVGYFVWSMRRFDKQSAESDRHFRERSEKMDEEHLLLSCGMWSRIGEAEHRAHCQRCMGRGERVRA